MGKTSIEWCDHSINPIRALDKQTGRVGHFCEKISPGCGHCYASDWNENRFGTGLAYTKANAERVKLFLDEAKLQEVLRRKKPTRYFWCDMTDMFYAGHPDEWLDRCFAVMALTPQHTHMVLTKRPERMLAYTQSLHRSHDHPDHWKPVRVLDALHGLARFPGETIHDLIADFGKAVRAGLPNIWLGVSVENQEQAEKRIPPLLCCPAAVHFLSCEPLLGPADLESLKLSPLCDNEDMDGNVCGGQPLVDALARNERCDCTSEGAEPLAWHRLDWVIVGGESGPHARPCDIDWIRSLVGQCKAAGVACFVKQLGANPYVQIEGEPLLHPGKPATARVRLKDPKGGNPGEWPEDLRVRQVPQPKEVPHAQ